MFLLLPFIYFINKTGHTITETKNFFKHENLLLTPGIKKRGFYKTISKVSNIDIIDDKETNLRSISTFPSRRVEEIVDEIIDEILKYYVIPYADGNNWKFKNTESFLKKFLKKLISEVVHRMSIIEWNIFFCNIVLDSIKNHINFLKSRNNQNDDNIYFVGKKTEELFVEAISNRLLRSLLDNKYVQCEIVYQFCIGLFGHQVIKRTVNYYCDPLNHNQWIFKYLLERKITRSKLNKQIPHFQYDMSFEDFFKMVESINDLNEVKQIKQKLINELRMAEVLKFTQSNADSKSGSKKSNTDLSKINRENYKGHLLSQRDLKCYSNQLSTLLDTVNTKLKMMTKGKESTTTITTSLTKSKRRKSIHRNSKSEKQTLSKKIKLKVSANFNKDKSRKSATEKSSTLNECIPYETLMDSGEGRKFFKEFLNTTTYSRTVELIEMLDHLQKYPEEQYVIAQGIVKRYIHSSPPAFEFDKQLVKEMEEFLKGNSTERVFLKAKDICDKELKQHWYPYFILSPNYEKFSKHLNKELNSIESIKMMDISPPGMSTDTEETDIESDESEISRNILANNAEKIITHNENYDSHTLLFDFTQTLGAKYTEEQQFGTTEETQSIKQIPEQFYGHTDEEYEDDEDGFVMPVTSGNETIEYYQHRIRRLNQKIEVKEKAYKAGISVFNQMPLSKKEKSKMKLDLSSVEDDLNRLYEKRNRCHYNLSRIDKWMMSMGNWNAIVYDVVLPEPKRGTSLDLGYLPTLAETKPGSSTMDRDDISLDDETKQVVIFIMVSLASTLDQQSSREDNGWLVKHTLKDFQSLKRELSAIWPGIDKANLPKVPQRLFIRRKYTDNDISHIKKCLNEFIMFVMKTPSLAKSETVFKFFCSSQNDNQVPNEDNIMGPFSSIANTLSDASAKVMLMAKIPSKFVLKVLAPRKQSVSVTSLDSESTDSRSEKKNTFRRISGSGNVGGSLKHKIRKLSHSKDISMSAFELLEELIQLRKSLTLTRRSMITFIQSFFGKNLSQILTEKVAWIKSESTVFKCLQKYRDSFRKDLSEPVLSTMETTIVEGESKLHPSASAFITQPVSDTAECNLQQVNSNSSPTMNKARFYQKNANPESCENILGNVEYLHHINVVDGDISKTGINLDQTWLYSIKCDEAVKRLVWESVPEYWKTLFGNMSVADSIGFVFESLQSLEANKALIYKILQSFIDELLEDDEPLYLTS